MSLIFCTSNQEKLKHAQFACQKHGINLVQIDNQIDEIQSEDLVAIIKHKATSMFDAIQKPLVVSDDSWSIPALNGFPGPYMKSMNHWFTAQDWLNIMQSYTNRQIFLTARLAYIDNSGLITIFEETDELKLLNFASEKPSIPISQVASLLDKNIPLSELPQAEFEKYYAGRKLWNDFLNWYKK